MERYFIIVIEELNGENYIGTNLINTLYFNYCVTI